MYEKRKRSPGQMCPHCTWVGRSGCKVKKPLHFPTLRSGIQFVGIIRLFYLHFVPVIYMEHKEIYYLQGLTKNVVSGCLLIINVHNTRDSCLSCLLLGARFSQLPQEKRPLELFKFQDSPKSNTGLDSL